MKLLYKHENSFFVANAKAIVETHGIDVVLKNEFTGGRVAPGHIELPDLWVVEDADYYQAADLIETSLSVEEA